MWDGYEPSKLLRQPSIDKGEQAMTTTESKAPYRTRTLEFRDLTHLLKVRVAIIDRMDRIKDRIRDPESTLDKATLYKDWKDLREVRDSLT